MKTVEPSIWSDWLLYIVGAIAAACTWLVRKVLTNEAQVNLIKQQIDKQDEERKEMRSDLRSIRDHILKSK